MAQIKAADVGISNGVSLAPQFMNANVMGANAPKIAMWLEKGTALEQSDLLQYLREARSKFKTGAPEIATIDDIINKVLKYQPVTSSTTGGSQTTQTTKYKLNQNLSKAILQPNGGFYTDVSWLNQLSVPNLSQPINIEQFVRRQIGATPADGLAIMNAIKVNAPTLYQGNSEFLILLNDNIGRWEKLVEQGNANPAPQSTGDTSIDTSAGSGNTGGTGAGNTGGAGNAGGLANRYVVELQKILVANKAPLTLKNGQKITYDQVKNPTDGIMGYNTFVAIKGLLEKEKGYEQSIPQRAKDAELNGMLKATHPISAQATQETPNEIIHESINCFRNLLERMEYTKNNGSILL